MRVTLSIDDRLFKGWEIGISCMGEVAIYGFALRDDITPELVPEIDFIETDQAYCTGVSHEIKEEFLDWFLNTWPEVIEEEIGELGYCVKLDVIVQDYVFLHANMKEDLEKIKQVIENVQAKLKNRNVNMGCA